MPTRFPEYGTDWATLRDKMTELGANDVDWRSGKSPMHVYYAGEDVMAVAQEAYTLFMTTNALSPMAFPSLARMEADVIAVTADLLNAPASARGSITVGGTESIILAVKAARDWSFAQMGMAQSPNIVVPASAHPAFEKAGHLLGVRVRRVPIGSQYETDVDAIADRIDQQTIMIVGSVPCLPYGLVDPISELSTLAQRYSIWLHVDACIGGFLAPFVRDIGYPLPDFDFSVPGVCSISADLHKYGYSAKGASAILYRTEELFHYQHSTFSDWPKGKYFTPTLVGTRSGGAIASAWATIHYLGKSGYREVAQRIMKIRRRLLSGIERAGDFNVVGKPQLATFAFTSGVADMMSIGDAMQDKGWYVSRIAKPPGIHQMVNILHEQIVDRYVDDVASSWRYVMESAPRPRGNEVITY